MNATSKFPPLPPHLAKLRGDRNTSRESDETIEIARPVHKGVNAAYPEKVQNAKTLQEYMREFWPHYRIDHEATYNQYIFIHDLDSVSKKARKREERKKYIASGAFFAASMTGVKRIRHDDNHTEVISVHQGLMLHYSRQNETEKIHVAGLEGNTKDKRFHEDESYFNKTLMEMIKAATLSVEEAQRCGWKTLTFGNTADPFKRYALKLACDRLGMDCSGENVDLSTLQQPAFLGESIADRMKGLAEQYMNFPLTSINFAQPSGPAQVPELGMEQIDPMTRRFNFKNVFLYPDKLDVIMKDNDLESAIRVANEANNPLIAELIDRKLFSRVAYNNTQNGSYVQLSLPESGNWQKSLAENLGKPPSQIHTPTPLEETMGKVLLKKATEISKVKPEGSLSSLFEKEALIAYRIEQHGVQETVRKDGGFLQFTSYNPETKIVNISISGNCNSSCNKLEITQGIVEQDLKTHFPKDVWQVRFQEVPSLALAA